MLGHDMIQKQDKVNILNNKISNLDFHINILEIDKTLDINEKPTKQSILNDLYNKKTALQKELAVIQAN